jgi:hypothetical protein
MNTAMPPPTHECSYFITYSGIALPFRLVEPLPADKIGNRNTYIRAWFSETGKLTAFDKMVYGEVELAHRYAYHSNGVLARAEIRMVEEDPVIMAFDEAGQPTAALPA